VKGAGYAGGRAGVGQGGDGQAQWQLCCQGRKEQCKGALGTRRNHGAEWCRGSWCRRSSDGGAGVVGDMGKGGVCRGSVGFGVGTVAPMQRYVVSKE